MFKIRHTQFGWPLALLVSLLAVLFVSCGQEVVEGEKLKIVTTTTPLFSMTMNIVGDKAEVQNMIPSDIEMDSYVPTELNKKQVQEADMLIINGAGLELFLQELLGAAEGGQLIVVDTSKGINLLARKGKQLGKDPYYWTDVKNSMKQVRTIRDALIQEDIKNAGFYQVQEQQYLEKLATLDEEIQKMFSGGEMRSYGQLHTEMQYFEKAYGLTPTYENYGRFIAEDTDTLIRELQTKIIPVVFEETRHSEPLYHIQERFPSIEIVALSVIDVPPRPSGYEETMRKVADRIKKTLLLP